MSWIISRARSFNGNVVLLVDVGEVPRSLSAEQHRDGIHLRFVGKKAIAGPPHAPKLENLRTLTSGIVKSQDPAFMTFHGTSFEDAQSTPVAEEVFWRKVRGQPLSPKAVDPVSASLIRALQARFLEEGRADAEGRVKKALEEAFKELPGFSEARLLELYGEVVVERVMTT